MFNLFGFVPMPIVIPMSSGGGNGDPNVWIAMLIVINMVCISIVGIKTIIWLFKYKLYFESEKNAFGEKIEDRYGRYRNDPCFRDYVLGFDIVEYTFSGANSMMFCLSNGIALFIWLTCIVMKFIGE